MNVLDKISNVTQAFLKDQFNHDLGGKPLQIDLTRKEFEGDYTLVVFPFVKAMRTAPEQAGKMIGEHLLDVIDEVEDYNVIKGFLNLKLSSSFWSNELKQVLNDPKWLSRAENGDLILVEYSSPNTNKPLHLGHLRNNFLGHSVSLIRDFNGFDVVKTQIINDRGVHICKSMWAYKEFHAEETPDALGIKGDKLVGQCYVEYDQEYKRQKRERINYLANRNFLFFSELDASKLQALWDSFQANLQNLVKWKTNSRETFNSFQNLYELEISSISRFPNNEDLESYRKHVSDFLLNQRILHDDSSKLLDIVNKRFKNLEALVVENKNLHQSIFKIIEQSIPSSKEVQQMLIKWESNDPETVKLWKMMNGWVYDGFAQTYERMGVEFDKLYYESDTYSKGKAIVEDALVSNIDGFYRKEDGSVWADLAGDGLDQKLLIRADGTTVYMTQDIGTAVQRYEDYPELRQVIYTVGDEQDYHFKVLFLILEKLGYDWAPNCRHLSYGMVDLPSGKMKSREGTVVDADDLMDEVVEAARKSSEEKGKLDEMTEIEQRELFEILGIGALKFFLLRVDPKKRMLFDPAESVSLNGDTGPFVQYTHARCRSVLRNAESFEFDENQALDNKERLLLRELKQFRKVAEEASSQMNPALIASYCLDIAKYYNQFYHDLPILKAEEPVRSFRLGLTQLTADTLKTAMSLLGIRVPERM